MIDPPPFRAFAIFLEPQSARGGEGGMDFDRQRGLRPAEGAVAAGRHRLPVRVYYEDTDFSGVVYHANYLRVLERGRTEFLRAAGVDQSALHAEGEGLTFAVRRMTIDYLRPARMDDVLVIETHTAEVRGASLTLAQRILRGEEVLVTAEVRVAAIIGGRPARIPDELRAVLAGRDEAAARSA